MNKTQELGLSFPKLVKGCTSVDSASVEIPIEDIEKFRLRHKAYQHGLIIDAVVKKELVSFYNMYHRERDEYGMVKRKYPLNQATLWIRAKDMPKFRRELVKAFEGVEVIAERRGINAGTPIAQSWEVRYKEIKVVGGDSE